MAALAQMNTVAKALQLLVYGILSCYSLVVSSAPHGLSVALSQ